MYCAIENAVGAWSLLHNQRSMHPSCDINEEARRLGAGCAVNGLCEKDRILGSHEEEEWMECSTESTS